MPRNTKLIYQASVLKYINAKDHFEQLTTFDHDEMFFFLSNRVGRERAAEIMQKGTGIYQKSNSSMYRIALTIF
jgi:hypothetical protein